MTVVLKLGGSVVTRKDEPETVDELAVSQAVDAIADAALAGDLVLVHGGGSFGHYHADRHGVTTTTGTRDVAAVRAIHDAMCRLDEAIVDRLHRADVPALPVHPLSLASRDEAGELTLPTAGVATMLAAGFVPVLHGDVVAHEGSGATVLSGDELVAVLARGLSADRVGLCSTVPGVLDEGDEVIDRIDDFDAVADVLGESAATDVTGGMAEKVRTLLALSAPASIFGADDLAAFLAGETPGTLVGEGDHEDATGGRSV